MVRYLESATGFVKLGYKISGDTGKLTLLETTHDYKQAMDRIVQRASVARSRAVSMDVKNLVSASPMNVVTCAYWCPCSKVKPPAPKLRKRSHQDDIPPDIKDDSTQLKAYNQLECTIRCEAHCGHCYIDRVNGLDNHRRLDHAQMSLWAKKIVSLYSSNQEVN